MKQRIGGKPAFKRFELGEILRGKIIDFQTIMISGQEREVVIIEEEGTGLEWTVILTKALTELKKLAKLSVVEIVYRGAVKIAGNKTFKKFDLFLITPEPGSENTDDIPF